VHGFTELKPLMLATTALRTRTHWGHTYMCTTHMKRVDRNHINECTLINGDKKVTEFVEELNGQKLY
jgi:hypothetical protein